MNEKLSLAVDRLDALSAFLDGYAGTFVGMIENAPDATRFTITADAASFHATILQRINKELGEVEAWLFELAREEREEAAKPERPRTFLDMVRGTDQTEPEQLKRGSWLDAKEGVAGV